MNNIILDALDYFHDRIKHNVTYSDANDNEGVMPVVTIDGVKMRYNILGVITHDNDFIWAWYLPLPKREFTKSKLLIKYAIDMDILTLQDAYIKRILSTPIHNIENDNTNLKIILALGTYLTKAHKIAHRDMGDILEIIALYDI